MSWWTTDVINRWTAVTMLLVAVAWLITVLAGMRLPEGQCGHPTVRGGLCKRPRLAGRPHCGIPAHRPDWQLHYTASALACAAAGALLLVFHPLPRHDPTLNPTTTVPPVASYTPLTIPTPAASASATVAVASVQAGASAVPAASAAGATGGPADQGDYSRDDATAGGPASASGQVKVATVLVPDMVGLNQARAREQAAATDLHYVVSSRAVDDPAQDGVVIAQDPAGGTRGREGDTIYLVIGTYTAPAAPSTAPAPVSESTAPVAAQPSTGESAATSSPS